jgi:hypothetical protein
MGKSINSLNKIDDKNVNINQIKLEEEFCMKKPTPTTQSTTKQQGKVEVKPSKLSFLLPQRQQNIALVLGKIRIKVNDLIEYMITYNTAKLTPSVWELLL